MVICHRKKKKIFKIAAVTDATSMLLMHFLYIALQRSFCFCNYTAIFDSKP